MTTGSELSREKLIYMVESDSLCPSCYHFDVYVSCKLNIEIHSGSMEITSHVKPIVVSMDMVIWTKARVYLNR